MAKQNKRRVSGAHSVRIIAGNWRGSRIPIPAESGVRPTPDRVRETLFNWLSDMIPGARCLDLFAGTGILGFEALSRQAEEVWFVETDSLLVRSLRTQITRFSADAKIIHEDASAVLEGPVSRQFDIVFLDPPYQSTMLAPAMQALEANDWLGKDALVYAEKPAREPLSGIPPGWVLWRESKAGQVGYYLFRRQQPPD